MSAPASRCGALLIASLVLGLLAGHIGAQDQSSSSQTSSDPTSQVMNPALERTLAQLDTKTQSIDHLKASFTQERKTVLMREPLESTGTLLVKGPRMRWDTRAPHASVMLIDQRPGHNEVSFYYPDEALLEIHPLTHDLARLASFPLPSFEELSTQFVIEPDPDPLTDKRGSGLAIRMVPRADQTKAHLEEFKILIDEKTGLVWKAAILDPGGDRTTLTFTDLDTTLPVTAEQIDLSLPSGVEVVRTGSTEKAEVSE